MSLFIKRFVFWTLVGLFIIHSLLVYTSGTEQDNGRKLLSEKGKQGKLLFQKYNCTACHQLYGLGGYMGPDLTNVISTPGKGDLYARVFIQNGTLRMPDFHLNDEEITALIEYLRYVDATGISPVKKFSINLDGTISQQ